MSEMNWSCHEKQNFLPHKKIYELEINEGDISQGMLFFLYDIFVQKYWKWIKFPFVESSQL